MEIVEICDKAGLACGPVYSAGEIVDDPHIRARGSVVSVEDAEVGRAVRMASPAGRFSGFEARVGPLGPKLGENTDEILSDLLSYSHDQIEKLRRDGAI